MKFLRPLFAFLLAFIVSGCRKSGGGKVDAWTWEATDLKTRTSPDKSRRARADIQRGEIQLKLGEAGPDHPGDITVEHTEVFPEPKSGRWEMRWSSDSEFVVEHPDLGTKTWTVAGGHPMTVKIKSDWHINSNP